MLTSAVPIRAFKLAVLSLCWLWLAGCASWVQREADEQLAAGQPEAALRTLEQGLRTHPQSTELRASYLTTQDALVQGLLSSAAREQAAGRLEEAERALLRAQAMAPANERAAEQLQGLRLARRNQAQLQEAKGLLDRGQVSTALRVVDEALKTSPQDAALLALKREVQQQQRTRQLRESQAGLAEQRPISLDFRDAGLRTVLDLVSRNSGLNFVLDKDIRSDLRVTVFLKQVRVEDALDLIVSTHQLARKVLDERTVLIYPNTPDKQREYQEQVIRVFYLASAEAKGAAAFLKSMLKIKEPFVDERSNMLAVREAPETVALVERLVSLFDTQEPEVMLELEVLEIRSTRLTELGVKFPSTVSLTPLGIDGGGLTVANLRGLGEDRIGVSVGGVTLNLRREVGDFNILANPRVRARNREKAKILIGDKVPIITTTTSQAGFVSDTVTYLDVGLKLDIEPTIYANDEVAIKLALEVGTLAGQIKTTSGTVAYQISTRNASTALRLKDGETQLLAGLISREDRSSANRVPLAGDLPVLGRLFSSQLDDGSKTELVLAVTPHIVRNLRQPDASEAELWVGTEAYTRLRQAGGRVASEAAVPVAGGVVPSTGGAALGTTGASKPVGDNASAPPGAAGLTPQAPAITSPLAWPAAPPDTSAPGAAAPLGATVGLRWRAPASIKLGQEFELAIESSLPGPVRGLSLSLQTPPSVLSFVGASEGELFKQGGATVNQTAGADPGTGVVQVGVLRSGPSGATGSGVAMTLRFVATQAGPLELNLRQVEPVAPDGTRLRVALPPPLRLEVLP